MVGDAIIPSVLRSVEARSGHKLAVVWERGIQAVVDFTDTIRQGGVFAALENEALFSRVRLTPNRTKIEWPEPKDDCGEPQIDIDAESLFVMAREQNSAAGMHRLMSAVQSLTKSFSKGLVRPATKTDPKS